MQSSPSVSFTPHSAWIRINGDQGNKTSEMKGFSTDQLIFALIVGAAVLGITVYRVFFIF